MTKRAFETGPFSRIFRIAGLRNCVSNAIVPSRSTSSSSVADPIIRTAAACIRTHQLANPKVARRPLLPHVWIAGHARGLAGAHRALLRRQFSFVNGSAIIAANSVNL
jgi:hypothetical protein